MNKFNNFALRRPILFGFVIVFIYAFLGTITYPVHYFFPETQIGEMYGDALSKFIIFTLLLVLLWRFGWIKASGIDSLGNLPTWIIVAVVLAYKILAELYAFTGDMSLPLGDSRLVLANLEVSFSTGLVEEIMFRGLILVAMIAAWGHTKRGQIKAILLSSLYFGLMHLFNMIYRPAGVVIFQAIVLTLPGIFYAAFVLSRRSLWPAIVIHWLTNAAVNIKIAGLENYEETSTMWVIFAIALIPLMAYSAYLIWRLPDTAQYDVAKRSRPNLSATT